MEMRDFGRTGMRVSVFGFGCGAVGGLMVRGTHADQERAVARAVELGINYFDTAAFYGNGESERNLGRVLATLRPMAGISKLSRSVRMNTIPVPALAGLIQIRTATPL